jgi:integrase
VPYAEIPPFMAELRERQGATSRALEFCILTACRTGEVLGARWDEIEGDIWTIPAARMKGHRQHRVPLSARALEILALVPREHGNPHVFPGRRRHALASGALRDCQSRMGRTECVHGYRSSFRDWCGDSGVARELAEAALAHANGDPTEAAYLRTDALERRRVLMRAWSDFCGAIGNRAAVIELRGRR